MGAGRDRRSDEARAAGIAVIYQEFSLAPNLTVAQNIFLGNEPRRFGIVDRDRCNRRGDEIIARLGAPSRARPVSDLCSASASWSRSRERCRPTRASWSWTSRPRR